MLGLGWIADRRKQSAVVYRGGHDEQSEPWQVLEVRPNVGVHLNIQRFPHTGDHPR